MSTEEWGKIQWVKSHLILLTPQTGQGNPKYSFSEKQNSTKLWDKSCHIKFAFLQQANSPCYSCKMTVYKSIVHGLTDGQCRKDFKSRRDLEN